MTGIEPPENLIELLNSCNQLFEVSGAPGKLIG